MKSGRKGICLTLRKSNEHSIKGYGYTNLSVISTCSYLSYISHWLHNPNYICDKNEKGEFKVSVGMEGRKLSNINTQNSQDKKIVFCLWVAESQRRSVELLWRRDLIQLACGVKSSATSGYEPQPR